MVRIATSASRLNTGTSGTLLLACEKRAANYSLPYSDEEEVCIRRALGIVGRRLTRGYSLSSLKEVSTFLMLKAREVEHEVFWVLFADAYNRLITAEAMFRGTLTQTSVYPREVVKRALELNAAAVILGHNHPSGEVKPSSADERLTQQLRAALSLVDVQVLDHVIVSGDRFASMAEMGIL